MSAYRLPLLESTLSATVFNTVKMLKVTYQNKLKKTVDAYSSRSSFLTNISSFDASQPFIAAGKRQTFLYQ